MSDATCCEIDCMEPARFLLAWGRGNPDDFTLSCWKHVGWLISEDDLPITIHEFSEGSTDG